MDTGLDTHEDPMLNAVQAVLDAKRSEMSVDEVCFARSDFVCCAKKIQLHIEAAKERLFNISLKLKGTSLASSGSSKRPEPTKVALLQVAMAVEGRYSSYQVRNALAQLADAGTAYSTTADHFRSCAV